MMFRAMQNSVLCYIRGHNDQIEGAEYPHGAPIDPSVSFGLTMIAPWSSDATLYFKHPRTKILTYFTINGNMTTLYRKRCSRCGRVIACDAFAALEYIRDRSCLDDVLEQT